MENLQYSKILTKNWEIVALIMGVTIVLALIVSLLQPFQYAASTQILIIQKQEQNLDAYTATKSAERIAKNLSNIIYTSSFYNEVIESNSMIEKNFSQDSTKRRKEWKKNVKAKVIPETGILEINVYDVDRSYASQVVRSISHVLINKGAEYHGGGADVEIKIVDDVFVSKYPARPNIVVNSAIALILGLLFGSALVVLTEAKKLKNKQETEIIKFENEPVNSPLIEQETAFGFAPEIDTRPIVEQRNIQIKTMYDHLK